MTPPIVERFVEWAQEREDVRAALLVGSRARMETPADEFSDFDIVVLAREPDPLLDDASWVAELGDPAITFVEPTPIGGLRERRVLYRDGIDVDFAVAPTGHVEELLDRGASTVVARGVRVLVDKDGLVAPLLDLPRRVSPSPTAEDLREAISDFWYHAVWIARKLRRGELFVAKCGCDGYLKALVLRMLEWHASGRDTWHGGRFLEQWADPRALAALRHSYAYYEPEDVARALGETMDLFAWLARETCERFAVAYPDDEESFARELVRTVLSRSA